MDAVAVVRTADRWAARLLDALSEVLSARPVVVHSLGDAEIAIAGRGADVVVFDPAVTGTDFPLLLAQRGEFRIVGWLGSRSSPVVAALLGGGADEVLDASMGEEELVARLRRCLGRTATAAGQTVQLGPLVVNARLRTAEWQGRPLPLTARETQVLQALAAAHPGPMRREALYRLVWGWAMPRGDRTVDVNVKRLRDKMARAETGVEVRTVPGVGYALKVDADEAAVTGL